MSPERMLQQDMFTGDLVDNRTRAQKSQDRKKDLPQQEFLFSQGELAQPSKQHHFEVSSTAPLILRSEDPRTDEERELDQRLAIEAAMDPLFGEVAVDVEAREKAVGVEEQPDEEEPEEERKNDADPTDLRRKVYLELVRLSEEQAESLWIAPPYDAAYITQLRLAAVQARFLGLTDYEVTQAIQIGTFRGERRKEQSIQMTP